MSNLKKERFFLHDQAAHHRMVLQYHPQVGQLYVPNMHARIPNELGGYYVSTNAQGFRSDVDFAPAHGDRNRIVFLGDSFTAGFGVSNQDRFTDLLGVALDAEIYNYAVTGTGTDQQLLIFEQFARDVEADLFVFCVMVENIERNLNTHHRTIDRYTGRYVYAPKPYFKLENGQLKLYHSPVPRERPFDAPDSIRAVGNNGHSARQRLIRRARSIYYNPKMEFLRRNRSATVAQDDLVSKFVRASKFQPYPDYLNNKSDGWQLMAAILNRFIDQVSSTPVLIVPIPDSFYYRTAAADPVYQARFEALADRNQQVYVADVTSRITRLDETERAKMPFKHDFHFSPYGNARMADYLIDEIGQSDLLPNRRPKRQNSVLHLNGHEHPRKSDEYILGISCFYHNSAATIIRNGSIVASAEEERFTRIKHDRNFPHRAINYCLEEAGIQQNDLTAVVYYDNAYQTFERLLHTQLAIGEAGKEAWLRVIPSWLQQKLSIPTHIRRNLNYQGKILHEAHHRSHAASAFFPSPFEHAAILTIDGVGEWATASIGRGHGNQIEMLKEMQFPNSVGLLYSAFTQFLGFKVNNGEYKMMGLAPYGEPRYVSLIYDHLVDVKDDGSIELNMNYFAFLAEPKMTNEKFAALFGGPARHPDDPITAREMDIARSIQVVTEEIVMRMARHAYELTGEENLCLAGGVALNCVANGRLLREGPFTDLWIQPAAGDAGCSLGAALDVWHTYMNKPRQLAADGRSVQGGSYWGPKYSQAEIKAFLETSALPYHVMDTPERAAIIAQMIDEGKVIGHFSGRMEYGPRALGARSILGDARSQEMQTTINLKIKYRESFRPFAPSVLEECVQEYFELDCESPYMLLVAQVKQARQLPTAHKNGEDLFEIVKQPRSDIPAVTHVDYSARVQSVSRHDHPVYHELIKTFQALTDYGVIVNTSFNVRGEPIVCSPYDAYRCFMRTEMDVLVLDNFILLKDEQPDWPEEKGHLEVYDPDAAIEGLAGPETAALLNVFIEDFLPLSHHVRRNSTLRIQLDPTDAPTTWMDWSQRGAGNALFEIPPELDSRDNDPNAMAAALTRSWRRDDVNVALLPVVEKLLRIGNEYFTLAEDEELTEEVSDFVYVMY